MLLRTPENPLRQQVLDWLRARGGRPIVAAESDDADLLRILAIQGRGAVALALPAVRTDVSEGRLKVLTRGTGLVHEVWVRWPDVGVDGPVQHFIRRLPAFAARLKA